MQEVELALLGLPGDQASSGVFMMGRERHSIGKCPALPRRCRGGMEYIYSTGGDRPFLRSY